MNKNFSFAIGRVAALSIAIITIVFALSLILEIIFRTEFTKYLGYTASLLLPIGVTIMIASFYNVTRQKSKIFALLALVSAIVYAPFCLSTYFLQLSVVATNPLNLSSEVLKALTFIPGSPIFAIDMLGYVFLSLTTLAAGFALTDTKDKVLRALCFFHGALAIPAFASPILSGVFLSSNDQTNNIGNYVLLFWCVVFIPIALLFMRHFKQGQGTNIRQH